MDMMMMMIMMMFLSRTGEGNKPQPDNHSAIQAGKLTNVKVMMMMMIMMIMIIMMMTMPNVKDTSGLTIEGFQEFYDEACLAVLNNKYNDGIQWHDVPCYFRSH